MLGTPLIYLFLFVAGLFIISYPIYIYKVRKLKKTTHRFYYHPQPVPDIEEIGKIVSSGKPGIPLRTDAGIIRLHELTKIFKYRENRHTYWISYILENKTGQDLQMNLTGATVNISGQEIECNLVLSMQAPHNSKGLNKDNHYLNTRTHSHFMLGPSAERYLNFQARFVFEGVPDFKTTDTLSIHFDVLKHDTASGLYQLLEHDHVSGGFSDIRYKLIQMVNEELEYQS